MWISPPILGGDSSRTLRLNIIRRASAYQPQPFTIETSRSALVTAYFASCACSASFPRSNDFPVSPCCRLGRGRLFHVPVLFGCRCRDCKEERESKRRAESYPLHTLQLSRMWSRLTDRQQNTQRAPRNFCKMMKIVYAASYCKFIDEQRLRTRIPTVRSERGGKATVRTCWESLALDLFPASHR